MQVTAGRRILPVLVDRPATSLDLAGDLRLEYSTTLRALYRLEERQLVEHQVDTVPHVWTATIAGVLEVLAAPPPPESLAGRSSTPRGRGADVLQRATGDP